MGHFSTDEANKLFARVDYLSRNAGGIVDSSQAIKTGIEHMWAELVNWHLKQTGKGELASKEAIGHDIPVEAVSCICADGAACAELEWLQIVKKWIENPKIMELLNYD